MASCGEVGPSGPLKVSITHVNVTKGCRFGESSEEAGDCPLSGLFAALKREYGGRVSRVWRDAQDGPQHVGWTFGRRVEYEDASRIRNRDERTYLRETWATFFRDAKCACCGTVSGRWSVTIDEARKILDVQAAA